MIQITFYALRFTFQDMSTKSIDQLLDLLIDALEERKSVREGEWSDAPSQSADPSGLPPQQNGRSDYVDGSPIEVVTSAPDLNAVESHTPDLKAEPIEESHAEIIEDEVAEWVDDAPQSAEMTHLTETTEHIPTIDNMPRTMVRLFVALLIVIAFANLQLFDLTRLNAAFASGNTGETTVRFARDGMLLQGDGLKVYLMENNKRRWITTSEAFDAFGYRWGAVRRVEESYLQQFDEGEPIYLAMKCPDSLHVFAIGVLESGQRTRRWISDIETFQAMGFVWAEIDESRCNFLRRLPNGEPFPADVDRPIPSP